MPKNKEIPTALTNDALEDLARAHGASLLLEQQANEAARERNHLLLHVVDVGVRPSAIARRLGVERQRIHTLIQRAKRTG